VSHVSLALIVDDIHPQRDLGSSQVHQRFSLRVERARQCDRRGSVPQSLPMLGTTNLGLVLHNPDCSEAGALGSHRGVCRHDMIISLTREARKAWIGT
jgi:hypothetical protein